MLNVTTMIDATTVLAAIDAKIAVVNAGVRGLVFAPFERLDYPLHGEHPQQDSHPDHRQPGSSRASKSGFCCSCDPYGPLPGSTWLFHWGSLGRGIQKLRLSALLLSTT